MKPPSHFHLIRSELERAEAKLQICEADEKTRLKEAQDAEIRSGSYAGSVAERSSLSLETLTFAEEVASSFDHVSEAAQQARGRRVYRLIQPNEARKNELIARALADLVKPRAA